MIRFLRYCLLPLAIVCGLVSAVFYVLCTYLPDQNPSLRILWQVSASAALLASFLELALLYFDSKERKALRSELAATKQMATETAKKQAPRVISQEQVAVIKKFLATPEFHEQQFMILVDLENEEGQYFSRRLCAVLKDCGWFGDIKIGYESGTTKMSSGVSIWTAEMVKYQTNSSKDVTIRKALGLAGIQTADRAERSIKLLPIPDGVIEISVGNKPM